MTSAIQDNVIFKAKSKQAFVIKILGELLCNTLDFSQFTVNERGIFLLQSDTYRNRLVDISLYRENFTVYKCTREINFLINSNKFYKLLKNIKKKDSITISINEQNEDDPMILGICVEQSDNNNKLITNIRISPYQPAIIEAPTGYSNPNIMSGKEFQSIKNLHHTSDTMTVATKGEHIRFIVSNDDRHDRKLEIGNENDEENKSCPLYSKTFKTEYITSLCKCAGQSGNIQVFLTEDLPLKIKLKAGDLGDISVFIKSREMLKEEEDDEYLANDNEDQEEEEDTAQLIDRLSLNEEERRLRRGRQKRTST